MQPVICLIAPTASGKTALAYELFDTGNYALISVDSALIYRDMDIGTAKPSRDELAHYTHALVDIIDPDHSYSVAQFVADADGQIAAAHAQGKTPLLVGGTMMYYMALLQGIGNLPPTDPVIREQLNTRLQQEGIEPLYAELRRIDPPTADRLKPNDRQRIGRALEVYWQTGKPLSVWHAEPNHALADNPAQAWQIFAVLPDRAWLHARIEQRLTQMWQAGLLVEVIALCQRYDLHADLPSMRSVGYRQVWQFLQTVAPEVLTGDWAKLADSPTSLANQLRQSTDPTTQAAYQTMQDQALYATRQLAKRQYTWLRKLNQLNLAPQHRLYTLADVQQMRDFL